MKQDQHRRRSMMHEPDKGKSRPTPERVSRGTYQVFDGENAGETYAQDMTPDPLSRLLSEGKVSSRQYDAGRAFEALAHRVRGGGPGQRSCLDFTPIGHDEGEGNEEMEREWKDLRSYLGFVGFQAVDAVCYRHEEAHPLVLSQALSEAANFFQLPG
jgi:hypothetical protein